MPKSSKRWLKEHFSDAYVKKAQRAGVRSRAVYKLQEIHEQDKLFKPGMVVIDLGAAPGSWSAFVATLLEGQGRVIALDLLPIEPFLSVVEIIQGDFREEAVLIDLLKRMGETKADWVISDMAPNFSGIDSVDQPRSITLAELAFDFAQRVLNAKGGLLVKVFQGEGFEAYLAMLRVHFERVVIRKPKASRGRSREVYILARNTKIIEKS